MRARVLRTWTVLLAVVVLLSACTSVQSATVPKPDDLVGRWSTQDDQSSLVLSADGTFRLQGVPIGIVENVGGGDSVDELRNTRRLDFSGTWLSGDPASPGLDLNGRPRVILSFVDETSTNFESAVLLFSTLDEKRMLRFEIGDPDNGEYFGFEKQ